MAYPIEIEKFAQSVNLAVNNRYIDDIQDEDGQILVSQVVDYLNQYLDELERTTDTGGNQVFWRFMTSFANNLGQTVPGDRFSLPSTVAYLVTDEDRLLELWDGDRLVSQWVVADPQDLSNRRNRNRQMVASVGGEIIFSRELTAGEVGCDVVADVCLSLPRMTESDFSVLDLVKPQSLLIMGIAKNMSLPHIVQGPLSPSFTQKYNDILQQAIRFNNASSSTKYAITDNFSDIGGIY